MAKVLIDLGTPGFPNTGDSLPVGGEKLNNHINDVYDAFSRKGAAPEDQILQATGVYQYVGYDNTILDENSGRFVYQSKVGEMLSIDMEGAVEIKLPDSAWVGSHVKIFRAVMSGPNSTFVSCSNGNIQNLPEVVIPAGVQYQFISTLDYPKDGEWSQRIIDGTGAGNNQPNVDSYPVNLSATNYATVIAKPNSEFQSGTLRENIIFTLSTEGGNHTKKVVKERTFNILGGQYDSVESNVSSFECNEFSYPATEIVDELVFGAYANDEDVICSFRSTLANEPATTDGTVTFSSDPVTTSFPAPPIIYSIADNLTDILIYGPQGVAVHFAVDTDIIYDISANPLTGNLVVIYHHVLSNEIRVAKLVGGVLTDMTISTGLAAFLTTMDYLVDIKCTHDHSGTLIIWRNDNNGGLVTAAIYVAYFSSDDISYGVYIFDNGSPGQIQNITVPYNNKWLISTSWNDLMIWENGAKQPANLSSGFIIDSFSYKDNTYLLMELAGVWTVYNFKNYYDPLLDQNIQTFVAAAADLPAGCDSTSKLFVSEDVIYVTGSFVFGIDPPRIAINGDGAGDWVASDETVDASLVTVEDINGYHGSVFVFGDFSAVSPGNNTYTLSLGNHGISESALLPTKTVRSYK